ncbi:MAG: bifunctional helix-turn-helix domain-containing protein/methylated-DNA--[protein]-cysteine S-methyltransferase [Cohaesibacter sp.]|nr:bifunctional helix-turn-helix domain-containing protein/methylated-DNA--[protein]-cysteine S-methyltransferase [Cohaesibacter sp.]
MLSADYDLIRRSIEYLTLNWRTQPTLDDLADHIGLSQSHMQRLFTRWTGGLSPKGFIQAVTLDHAKHLLDQSASIMETAFEVGLSGPSRLHDLFISHEAMTPGTYKAKGKGLTIRYAFHPCPFGMALVMISEQGGLIGMAFCDSVQEEETFADMSSRWPNAAYQQDPVATLPVVKRSFEQQNWQSDQPLRITLIGTDFEIRVWESLLKIPMGHATSYSAIANHLGKPNASRAVGAAVGRNPISFVVPCHRVMAKSGKLCGYHWGLTRKQAMLGWEKGHMPIDVS